MFKEIWYLYKRKMLSTLRQPVWIVITLSMPLMFLAFFAPLLEPMGQTVNDFVPRILTMLAFSAGMGAGWDMIMDLRAGVIERFRVTPTNRSSMLLGGITHDITMFLVPAGILLLIVTILPLGFAIDILGLLVLLVLLCLMTAVFSAFATALALKLKEMASLSAVASGMQMPLMLLSGMFIPLSFGPPWLQVLGHFSPLYYTVEAAARLASGDILTYQVGLAFAVFIPLAVLTIWWATRVFRTAVK